MNRFLFAAAATMLLFGCDGGKTQSAQAGDGKADKASTARSDGPTVAAKADTVIDLSVGGPKWKGWTMKGAPGAKAADDGAGGLSVAFGTFNLSLVQGKMHIADMKSGAKAGAEAVGGKVTFSKDTPDALEYVTELKDVEGKPAKAYGFAMYVDASGTKVGCSGDATNEADLASAKQACASIQKK